MTVTFNNGFVTALALFYGHREQFKEAERILKWDLRIYGATDHLFDIEYPRNLDPELKEKVQHFVDDAVAVRLECITMEEGDKLFNRCLELLKEIDKKYFGLEVEVKYP